MSSHPDNRDESPIVVQVLATLDQRGQPTQVTLELLGDAVALAKRLNGKVAAWVVQVPTETLSDATLNELAAHGCERVDRLTNERFSSWSSEAVAAALAFQIEDECRAILLPGNARGEEVAALLTERLQSLWIPDVLTMAVTRQGALEATAVEPGGRLSRVYRAIGDKPAVVTIRPGVAEVKPIEGNRGLTAPARLVCDIDIDLSYVAVLTTTGQSISTDPETVDITWAERIVAAGRGTGGPEGMKLVASLARDLSASPAASRMAVDLGWASAERQVGQTGKTVRPDLYVACGISGASHHLAGMRDSKHIIALNTDADAPIHQIAHLSLCGDLHEVVPAIRERLVGRRHENSGSPSISDA